MKLRERILQPGITNYPMDSPQLFIRNANVDEFNSKAHHATKATKYTIKAHDSVVGAKSQDLKEKILKQIPKAVEDEMKHLRMERKLDLCISPIYNTNQNAIKICFLNTCSLHKHITNVRTDSNYLSTDVSISCETRFRDTDCDTMYDIDHYTLFRNDSNSSNNE